MAVIGEGQGPTGGFLASPTFGQYRYSWFRDGAFIADAMSRAGHRDRSELFFDWCSQIVTSRADMLERLIRRAESDGPDSVGPDEHLHTRYTLDGRESDDEWWTFQLDGYGAWIWALAANLERGGEAPATWDGVELTVRYLSAFWREPSYDWWEENIEHRHVSTLGSIWAGFDAVSRLPGVDAGIADIAARDAKAVRVEIESSGLHEGRLAKWLGGDAIDASLLACVEPFRLYPATHPIARATVAEVESELTHGGVHRYLADTYYGGGEWVLLAGFLGLAHLAGGECERAMDLLAWMADQADGDGHLPEQVDTHMLDPTRKDEWVRRWGTSADPLLWSHAMYLSLAIELGVVESPVKGIQ